jgi:hypothetical protein
MKVGLLRFGRVHRERVRERAMVAQLARFLLPGTAWTHPLPGEIFCSPRATLHRTLGPSA